MNTNKTILFIICQLATLHHQSKSAVKQSTKSTFIRTNELGKTTHKICMSNIKFINEFDNAFSDNITIKCGLSLPMLSISYKSTKKYLKTCYLDDDMESNTNQKLKIVTVDAIFIQFELVHGIADTDYWISYSQQYISNGIDGHTVIWNANLLEHLGKWRTYHCVWEREMNKIRILRIFKRNKFFCHVIFTRIPKRHP